jgi:hypothetical protein
MQTLRDHLPQQLCNLPGTQRCALHVSQLWAGALTVMALVGLVRIAQQGRLAYSVHTSAELVSVVYNTRG